MAAMHYSTCILPLFLILHLFSPSTSVPVDTVCKNTPFPSFCKSILPSNNSASLHDYGRFSIQQSISRTKSFLSLVNGHLANRNTLPMYTARALEDCQLLATLNIDFLSESLQIILSTDTLQTSKVNDLQTALSATLTNHQTCSDGIEAITSPLSIKNDLKTPISNTSMLHSVSLAIFVNGWGQNATKGRLLGERMRKLYTIGDDVKVSQTVVVDPSGNGNFTTISDAVAAAPNNTNGSNGYFLIYVVAGVYEEYVTIDKTKKYLMMVGDGINQTIITGNRSVDAGWTTFYSATFGVIGQGFVGVDLTFRNTAGAINNQAVALRNDADLTTFYRCSFEGYQDTLYPHTNRQFYRECDIYGTVDFIFGNAAVVLQNCNIYPRLPLQGQFNTITAQGKTDINQNTGTSIQNCTITAAEDLGSTKTYLGRPWKEYSTAVYMESFMDSLIDPAGWSVWSGDFALNTSYYAEFDNSGPGSNTSNRVTWPGYHVINATDAVNFTVSNFISGDAWLPATGVPYNGGLF